MMCACVICADVLVACCVLSCSGGASPVEMWLDVRLNHHNAADTTTFPMRFFYDDEFAGEHVVLVVGGEGGMDEAGAGRDGGAARELARQLGAALLIAEHRYYGQSRPTNDTSTVALRHLTVEHALGDIAQLINHVTNAQFFGGRHSSGHVVAVGCGYAGTLATWLRLSRPHLVLAALAESAPLHAQEDFPEYLETVGSVLREGGEACYSGVQESVERLQELLATPAGPADVSQLFNTCGEMSGVPLDAAALFAAVGDTFAHFAAHALSADISAACVRLSDTSLEPVRRLAEWVVSERGPECLEARYLHLLAEHTNTSVDAPQAHLRLWRYQACSQLGWLPSTSGGAHPFRETVPLSFYHQTCRDYFGSQYDADQVAAGVQRSVTQFGAGGRVPPRVVSVVGARSPWAPLAAPAALHALPLTPVYHVHDAGHCTLLSPATEQESEELGAARVAALRHLAEWVRGPDVAVSGAPPALVAPLATLATVAAALLRYL